MSYSHLIQKNCLIIQLSEIEDDMSFINSLFSKDCKHLILDLTEVSNINTEHLTKFTKFGKNLVQTNSFIMISNQLLNDEFLVVPTLQEAFDLIEIEDIERSLKHLACHEEKSTNYNIINIKYNLTCTTKPLYSRCYSLQDSTFGLWPDTIQNLPIAAIDTYYEEHIQIKTPATVGEVMGEPYFIDSPLGFSCKYSSIINIVK